MALQQSQHSDSNSGSGHGQPYSDARFDMLRIHHQHTLWVYWLIVILGVWMIAAPLTFDYGKGIVDPSGGRDLWLTDAARVAMMFWSDLVSGAMLLVFGWRSLTPNRPVSLWLCCFTGIWLTCAPLLLWAPTAAAYINSTLVGALVIALTILIPGMPNMVLYMQMGEPTPPGWSYNPSSWTQRSVLIVLAFFGWLISRYLAAYQLGYINHAFDPFFHASTQRVLDSDMSHMWPLSDAGLGATAYTFEFLMLFMGGAARWRTMPWMVLFFGILVIPLGLVHIILVISQPVVVGEWCTLCLLAAGLMLLMIPLTVDEVVAMMQHVLRARRNGESTWRVFWKGGTAEADSTPDDRTPALQHLPEQPGGILCASLWGMSFPWALSVSAALGVWLMFTPWALGVDAPASHSHHLLGALVLTVAVIAMGEPVRIGRYLNVLLAVLLIGAGWLLDGTTLASRINDAVVGIAIIVLAIPRGRITERFGTWDRYVR